MNDQPKTWPTTELDWRQIRPGDVVWEVQAKESPTGKHAYAFRAGDGREHRATTDAKSAIMGERHLAHWAKAGVCTTTLEEARRIAATRRGR